MLEHTDLAPTLLEAAGAVIPEAMEGKSFLKLLTEGGEEVLHERLITQECTWQAKWAIRTDDLGPEASAKGAWKLIKAREPDMHGMPMRELYDLKRDPNEMSNLVRHRPDIAEALEEQLEAWIAAMMQKNGLDEDPLVAQGITLGKDWREARGRSA